MQRLLKEDRTGRVILHGEAQRQGLRENHGVGCAKRLGPEWRPDIAVVETEGQGHRLAAGGFDAVEVPWRCARKAVLRRRRRVRTGAKPGEDDWNSAADRPARRKRAVGAGKEHRPLARRLPTGHLRALQVNLTRHAVERDRCLDQSVLGFNEIENPGNAEFASKLLRPHHSLLPLEIMIAIAAARSEMFPITCPIGLKCLPTLAATATAAIREESYAVLSKG